MVLAKIREVAVTGDVLLVEGIGFFPRLIRIFTAQQFSHAALVLRIGSGFFVAEMKEDKEDLNIYDLTRWLTTCSGKPFFGQAPKVVQDNQEAVKAFFNEFQASKPKYGKLTLLLVWISQITGYQFRATRQVCSTFVQQAWKSAGYECGDLESPGGLLDHLQALYDID